MPVLHDFPSPLSEEGAEWALLLTSPAMAGPLTLEPSSDGLSLSFISPVISNEQCDKLPIRIRVCGPHPRLSFLGHNASPVKRAIAPGTVGEPAHGGIYVTGDVPGVARS